MTATRAILLIALSLVFSVSSARLGAQGATTSAEIDRTLWAAISASVANDDIDAMRAGYHPAAVLVSNKGTVPIAQALAGWGKDMEAAKKTGRKASVAFKFSKRQDDPATAFEVGLFRYSVTNGGKTTHSYVHFEALLTKAGKKWQTLMERQLDAATEAEWNTLH